MKEQLDRIKIKLAKLKEKDPTLQVFGAGKHKYMLLPVLPENVLRDFELKYQITLPEGYREFLKSIGNGGAGPYYGLEPLEDTIFADLDYKKKGGFTDPSKEFPLTEAWNVDFRNLRYEDHSNSNDGGYEDKKWSYGLLRISNYGCGVSMNLVVNGKEYGKIWVDDRCNDGGIYPDHYFGNKERIDFLTWYELWLDSELKEGSQKQG